MARKTSHDEAAHLLRAAGAEPLVPYPGNHAPWLARCCACGREVTPRFANIKRGCRACVYCAGRKVAAGDAVEIMRAQGVEPLVAYPGAQVPWLSRCMTCKREIEPRLSNVKMGHRACAYCAGSRVNPAEAEAALRAAGTEPLEPYPGATARWRGRCTTCGREVFPRYSSVRLGFGPCVYCAGNAIDPLEAAEAMRQRGAVPLVSFPGSPVPWLCSCVLCGRDITPTYNHVSSGHHPCKWCADKGFWGGRGPARLYLLVHSEWAAIKVGIMRENTKRLAHHRAQGWALIEQWDGLEPDSAFVAEQAVLDYWRERGIPGAVAGAEMPQGGSSETAPVDLVDLAETRRVIALALARAPIADAP